MKRQNLPEGYVLISATVDELRDRMFGGLQRPEPIVEIKRRFPRLRVGFGAWREHAAKRLRDAAAEGEISVYVCDGSAASSPTRLSTEVVKRLIPIRRGLPDHPYRIQISFLRTGLVTQDVFAALQAGVLVLREDEFEHWCELEHGRRLWPSQRSAAKPKRGRPSKNTNALRSRVMALVEEGIWAADQPVMSLHRALVERGYRDLPSHDSLSRLVDNLHLETGDPRMRRAIRCRRR